MARESASVRVSNGIPLHLVFRCMVLGASSTVKLVLERVLTPALTAEETVAGSRAGSSSVPPETVAGTISEFDFLRASPSMTRLLIESLVSTSVGTEPLAAVTILGFFEIGVDGFPTNGVVPDANANFR